MRQAATLPLRWGNRRRIVAAGIVLYVVLAAAKANFPKFCRCGEYLPPYSSSQQRHNFGKFWLAAAVRTHTFFAPIELVLGRCRRCSRQRWPSCCSPRRRWPSSSTSCRPTWSWSTYSCCCPRWCFSSCCCPRYRWSSCCCPRYRWSSCCLRQRWSFCWHPRWRRMDWANFASCQYLSFTNTPFLNKNILKG